MPRKIRPKYGIDPVQQVPAFFFIESEIERLLRLLRPVSQSHDAVIAKRSIGAHISLASGPESSKAYSRRAECRVG